MHPVDAKFMAVKFMIHYNLKDWTFEFDGAKRRLGRCNYKHKLISLSMSLTKLNNEDVVRETILHEIAHALAGPGTKHGPVWRSIARKIGCKDIAACCTTEINTPKGRYVGVCPKCTNRVYNYRRPKNLNKSSCGKCSRRFDPTCIFKWYINNSI